MHGKANRCLRTRSFRLAIAFQNPIIEGMRMIPIRMRPWFRQKGWCIRMQSDDGRHLWISNREYKLPAQSISVTSIIYIFDLIQCWHFLNISLSFRCQKTHASPLFSDHRKCDKFPAVFRFLQAVLSALTIAIAYLPIKSKTTKNAPVLSTF